MTFTNSLYSKPTSVNTKSAQADTLSLLIHGQGVIVFDTSESCSLQLWDSSKTSGLTVSFTSENVVIQLEPSKEVLLDKICSKGLNPLSGAYYWFSIDSQNQRLYAGVGEPRIETAIYSHTLRTTGAKQFLEKLIHIQSISLTITRLIRDPITNAIPLQVKSMDELTMDSLALATYMPKANLSMVSQKLYDCIAGSKFHLDSPDFPQFTQAIEHSIATPGKWCYERLKQKATEFNKDKPDEKETYLRITLGENNGESPGIPYVMEIWPIGHYSPIHNHGGASAIIRVLNGAIQVNLYPFLSETPPPPFAQATFQKDDITWISPTLNQIHKLHNPPSNTKTCITIQCYMYETSDKKHYDYFDYVEESKGIQQFEPDSDMDFIEFKKIMKKEWLEQATQTKPTLFSKCFPSRR